MGKVDSHLVTELEELLYTYSVDILFSGHFHAYQRTCAVYKGKCIGRDEGGITHVMIGSAGASLDTSNWVSESWDEYHYHQMWGYGRIHVDRKSLTVEYVLNNSTVIDSITLSH